MTTPAEHLAGKLADTPAPTTPAEAEPSPRDPSLAALRVAAAIAGWDLADIWGVSRGADLVAFRRAVARHLVEERGWSVVGVARLLRRHHSSVSRYLLADNRQAVADWRDDLAGVRRAFGGGP